jgi:hypothetical protein
MAYYAIEWHRMPPDVQRRPGWGDSVIRRRSARNGKHAASSKQMYLFMYLLCICYPHLIMVNRGANWVKQRNQQGGYLSLNLLASSELKWYPGAELNRRPAV